MMTDRKSGRARKIVDYSKFAANGEDDDDFATATPPQIRKKKDAAKTSKKTKADPKMPSLVADVPQLHCASRPRTDRKCLNDALYERDLELAMKLSTENPASSPDVLHLNNLDDPDNLDPSSQDSECGQICGTDLTIVAEVAPPTLTRERNCVIDVTMVTGKENTSQLSATNCPGVSLGDTDCIEILEDVRPGRPARSAGKRGVKRPALDTDWGGGSASESESEASTNGWGGSEDDDSDFSGDKLTKKIPPTKAVKKKSPTKPKAKKAVLEPKLIQEKINRPAKMTKTPKSGITTPVHKSSISAMSPVIKSVTSRTFTTPSPATGLSSSHKSPLGGACIKSPLSGGIRLGLSKKARVKSLHPSVLIKH